MGVTLYCGYKGSGSKAEFVAIPNKCLLLLRGLVQLRREFGEALGCHRFSCSESVGFVFCSPTWFCSPRSEDAILPLQQWPAVSLNQHRSCQKGLRSAQLVSSRWMSWIIQIRAWEPMWFGKWPFCPPQENLMFAMWGGKGLESWESLECSCRAKEALLSGLCSSPDSAPQQGFARTKVETQTAQSRGPQGDSPTEDFTLTSVSMQQRLWKPRMEGNLRSPNPTLCLMGESLSRHSPMAQWSSAAAWIPFRTKNLLPPNGKDDRGHYVEDLLCHALR